MAGKGATLSLKITGDASDGIRALDQAEGKTGLLSSGFAKAAAGAAVVGGAVLALGKQAFDAASDLQQNAGAVDAIFGTYAGKMHGYADQAAQAVGLSKSQYSEMAAVLGAQLKNAGYAGDELAGKVNGLIGQGADLAAQFGGSASDAVEALSSAFKGETDPIERYGVSIKQADINTQIAADGHAKLTGAALKQAQAQAVMELVTAQTSSATGAWNAQTDTAAERQQTLTAKLENVKAKIGEGLLPIFSAVAGFISDKMIPWFEKLTEKGGPVSDMFEKVSTFVKEKVIPAVSDLVKWISEKAVPIWDDLSRVIKEVVVPAFEKIWGYINDYVIPVLKTILPPIIDGVKDVIHKLSDKLIENKDKFADIYEKVKPFLDFLRDKVAPFISTVLTIAFDALGKAIDPVIDSITWILDKAASVLGFLGKAGGFLFGGGSSSSGGSAKRTAPLLGAARGAAPLRLAAAGLPGGSGGATGAAGLTAAAGGDTWNITITGVLDADDAAEQIDRLLSRRARMTGAALAAVL